MELSRRIGAESIAWSLRRWHCPVTNNALVLEVGSGGNPYYRANVLCDAYLQTRERHFVPLVHDRPTVLGFAEKLPFRDGVFDFVIASHVLEHSQDPERFFKEIQRVGHAGYIEVPDAFMERLTSYLDHRSEITLRDSTLIITKKSGHIVDQNLSALFSHRASRVFPELVSRHPFEFHVRYYWAKTEPPGLQFIITNPECDTSWAVASSHSYRRPSLSARAKSIVLDLARWMFSQRRRNRALDVMSLIQCPECASTDLREEIGGVLCVGCQRLYPKVDGNVIDFAQSA